MSTYREELFAVPERILPATGEPASAELSAAKRIVFCGCGTSFYLGGQCAAICAAQGRSACAVDAVELLTGAAEPDKESCYVFISRSGNSQEAVLAQAAVSRAGAYTYYLGCTPDSRLALACNDSRILPYGRESLILESYSFYVQLIAALRCCGAAVGEKLPERAASALRAGESCYIGWLGDRALTRVISLASPFYRPLHRELMLKDGEITQLPAEEWGILEFRHGPRSWCNETTLIHVVSEERTRDWDINVARELVSYGCPVIWYGGATPAGCYPALPDLSCGGATGALTIGAFHTSLAACIGRRRGTCPESLRHFVHNVGEL